MKPLKYIILFYFLVAFAPKSQAQNMDNITALLTEGYTIEELHGLTDVLTIDNHRSVLEKKGFKFEKNDTESGSYVYKKNDYVSFYVNYEKGKLTSVHFKSSPQKFYKAIAEIKDNSKFTYSSEKASGTGKLIYYKYSGHSMSTNDNYYRVTMWPKEESTTSSSSTTTPTVSPALAPTAIETYYSAKEIADAMNANIGWANINFSKPTYEFEVKGSMDMDKRSIRFISKSNVLYVQMNIPRNGECDYGLKEVKAKWTGQAGGGSGIYDQYYFTFEYPYSCGGIDYKNIYVTFKTKPSFTKAGIEAWIRKNAY
ncbi:hypothetical protein EZ428_16305 [Pedobacter frigiditerrae]|uniref:DUF4468 domain-containing protein n=1 Tax=Pedobacter frigiditerrae TaxID=2530452 RepID=A0A4R0MQW3_9SPHI|nr:hypothetical protein [Pedobacter frigiditerrae]TCC89258.1 hypothetical protein EZ428_16305 [Pedobacter frigiditerrae]